MLSEKASDSSDRFKMPKSKSGERFGSAGASRRVPNRMSSSSPICDPRFSKPNNHHGGDSRERLALKDSKNATNEHHQRRRRFSVQTPTSAKKPMPSAASRHISNPTSPAAVKKTGTPRTPQPVARNGGAAKTPVSPTGSLKKPITPIAPSEKHEESIERDSLASLRRLQPKLKLDLKRNYDYKPKR